MSNSAEDRTNAISELLSLSEESKSIDSAAAESKSRQVDSKANEEGNPSNDEALVRIPKIRNKRNTPSSTSHIRHMPGQRLKTFGDLHKMLIANGFDAADVGQFYVVEDTTQGNEIYPHVDRRPNQMERRFDQRSPLAPNRPEANPGENLNNINMRSTK